MGYIFRVSSVSELLLIYFAVCSDLLVLRLERLCHVDEERVRRELGLLGRAGHLEVLQRQLRPRLERQKQWQRAAG